MFSMHWKPYRFMHHEKNSHDSCLGELGRKYSLLHVHRVLKTGLAWHGVWNAPKSSHSALERGKELRDYRRLLNRCFNPVFFLGLGKAVPGSEAVTDGRTGRKALSAISCAQCGVYMNHSVFFKHAHSICAIPWAVRNSLSCLQRHSYWWLASPHTPTPGYKWDFRSG